MRTFEERAGLLISMKEGGIGITQDLKSEDEWREAIIKQEFGDPSRQTKFVANQYFFFPKLVEVDARRLDSASAEAAQPV